jgi:hypothetical protein
MTTPLFAQATEDLTVTTEEGVPEGMLKQILRTIREELFRHRMWAQWSDALKTRRHPDTHEEVDYELRLRELEGQLNDRDLRGFRMGNYHEEPKSFSLKDWLLGIMSLVIVGWLANISVKMDKLTEVVVSQTIQGKEIAQLRCTVYKTCQ